MNETTEPFNVDPFDGADADTVEQLLRDQLVERLNDDPELVVVMNRDGTALIVSNSATPLETLLQVVTEAVKNLTDAAEPSDAPAVDDLPAEGAAATLREAVEADAIAAPDILRHKVRA